MRALRGHLFASLRPATSPAHPAGPARGPLPAAARVPATAAPAAVFCGPAGCAVSWPKADARPADSGTRRALRAGLSGFAPSPAKPRRSWPSGLQSLMPSGFGRKTPAQALRAPLARANRSPSPAGTCLAAGPLRMAGPQTRPGHPRRASGNARASYGRPGCHGPCFPRMYITSDYTPQPSGRSGLAALPAGVRPSARAINVMSNRGNPRKGRASPPGVVMPPAAPSRP